MTRRHWAIVNLAGLAAMATLALVCLNFGSTHTTLWTVSGPTAQAILWQARLPRILLALAVGMALGGAGTAYQTLLRNPLADPYILGVAGGAALGAALGYWGNFPLTGIMGTAFATSFAAMLGIWYLARTSAAAITYRLLLIGVVCNAFSYALLMAMQTLLPPERAGMIAMLLVGQLTSASLTTAGLVMLPVAGGLWWLIRQSSALDAWALGNDTAASLGIDITRLQRGVFLAGSLMVGAAVATAGLIGFVGLIVPHAVRLCVGSQHRLLIPISAAAGGVFLLLTDTIARTILVHGAYQTELPVGVITALIGAPCFVWLLQRNVESTH